MSNSRAFPFVLGILITAMGAGFAYWMWTGYQKVAETYTWDEVPCTIIHSAIIDDTRVPNAIPDYRIDVLFRYQYGEKTRTSERVRTRVRRVKEVEKIEPFFETIPAGTQTVCFVNPADPDFAIHKRDFKAACYALSFRG
mgnify:CR=1 FL=1